MRRHPHPARAIAATLFLLTMSACSDPTSDAEPETSEHDSASDYDSDRDSGRDSSGAHSEAGSGEVGNESGDAVPSLTVGDVIDREKLDEMPRGQLRAQVDAIEGLMTRAYWDFDQFPTKPTTDYYVHYLTPEANEVNNQQIADGGAGIGLYYGGDPAKRDATTTVASDVEIPAVEDFVSAETADGESVVGRYQVTWTWSSIGKDKQGRERREDHEAEATLYVYDPDGNGQKVSPTRYSSFLELDDS